MLAPVLLPFHRAPKLHGGGRDHRLLGVERRLGAEAAADERRDHADRFEVALEQVGERAAAEVRRLRRRPHREHVGGGVVAGEHGAALERHGAAAMEEHLLLEHVRRAREGGVDVAVAHRGRRRRCCRRDRCARAGASGLAASRQSLTAGNTSKSTSRPRRRPPPDSGRPRSPPRWSGRHSRPRDAPARAACAAS